MENMITDFVFYFVIFLLPNDVLTTKRSSTSFLNSAFNGYEIYETHINRVNDYSLTQCSILCTETPSCMSINYNKISQTCVLFDKDFTDLSVTTRQMVDGWLYYYLYRDKETKPATCSAPYTSEICSRYCLHYEHHDPSQYAYLENLCFDKYGGEMVIIDRYLKHHCVQELLVHEGANMDDVYIQGKRNETSNLWTYNDGTAITYFNWNSGEPDNRAGEIYLGFMRSGMEYRWDDVYETSVMHATVCQQT